MILVTNMVWIVETQKPTEGTGVKTPTTYRRKPMAQVTYRGVKYNTDDNKQTSTSKQDLVYRGVKVAKKVTVAA